MPGAKANLTVTARAQDRVTGPMGKIARSFTSTAAAQSAANAKIATSARGMGAAFSSAKASIAGFMGPLLAVGGAVSAIKAVVGTTSELGEEMLRTSQKTGINVETLSRLRFAADQNGASMGALATGIRNISNQAVSGSQNFRRWGIDLKDSNGQVKDTESLLFEVADLMQNLESPTLRAAAAQQLMGRAGSELIPVLSQGSDGMRQMMAEADALGLTMSQGTAEDAVRFNDEMGRLKKTLEGLALSLGQVVLPALTSLFQKLRQGFQFVQLGAQAMIGTIMAAFSDLTMDDVRDELQKSIKRMDEANAALEQMPETARGSMPPVAVHIGNVGKAAHKAKDELAELRATLAAGGFDFSFTPIDEVGDLGLDLGIGDEGVDAIASKRIAAIEKEQAQFEEVMRAKDLALQQHNEEQARLTDEQLQRDQEAAQQQTQTAQGLGNMFGQTFAAIISGQQSVGEAMKGLLVQLAQQAIQTAVTRIATAQATAAAESVSAHASIPFVGVALGAAAASAAIALIASLAKFEKGGIVGEAGRSMGLGAGAVPIVAHEGELIIPAPLTQQLARLMGASGSGGAYASGGVVSSGGQGGGVTINVGIHQSTPMPQAQLDRWIRDTILPSFNRLRLNGALA